MHPDRKPIGLVDLAILVHDKTMNLQTISDAWNIEADEYNKWDTLGGDEMVEFTLSHIERTIGDVCDDLLIAVYEPDKSSITVTHAMYHIMEILHRW